MNISMSAAGRQMLIDLEGYKTRMYHDQAGLPTIGVGHLLTRDEMQSGLIMIGGKPVPWRAGLTRMDVDALLGQDLRAYEQAVSQYVTVDLLQWQADALISFCFNIGIPKFLSSTLLKRLNQREYIAVVEEMRRWRYVHNKGKKIESKGLINRRKREIACFQGGSHEGTSAMDIPPPQALANVSPRQYTPNRWLELINPLDWLPQWGTYLSIVAACILFVIDTTAYPIPQWAYAILVAFATARMRRAISRSDKNANMSDDYHL